MWPVNAEPLREPSLNLPAEVARGRSPVGRPPRALSARLKDLTTRHRADVAALEHALAAAHSESLLLRHGLAA